MKSLKLTALEAEVYERLRGGWFMRLTPSRWGYEFCRPGGERSVLPGSRLVPHVTRNSLAAKGLIRRGPFKGYWRLAEDPKDETE